MGLMAVGKNYFTGALPPPTGLECGSDDWQANKRKTHPNKIIMVLTHSTVKNALNRFPIQSLNLSLFLNIDNEFTI